MEKTKIYSKENVNAIKAIFWRMGCAFIIVCSNIAKIHIELTVFQRHANVIKAILSSRTTKEVTKVFV